MVDEHSQQTQQPTRIPEFASIEEEAEFWDTHDITDFLDETRPVTIRVGEHFSEGVSVRLDHETFNQLSDRAQEKGIGPSTLARMWILEKLREETERAAS